MTRSLSTLDRRRLLETARLALECRLCAREEPLIESFAAGEEWASAFVTITCCGELRGCTGTLDEDQPLAHLVAELAVSSATRDPRFPPLTARELASTRIEISVLSSPMDASHDEVQLGVHGLLIERDGRRGLLLPQVAVEHNFSKEQFLDAVCRKAGLAPGAWRREGTRLRVFTAEVFREAP